MFASLKKKLEEGTTPVVAVSDKKATNSTSSVTAKVSSPKYVHFEDTPLRPGSAHRSNTSDGDPVTNRQRESTSIGSLEDVSLKDADSSKEELLELLMKRTRQFKALETKYSELTTVMKEKNLMIEKLESALEKQQDVHCQRTQELNERYNNCRAKLSETVAAAVRKKEDEMKQQLKDLQLSKAELEYKVEQLEKYREKIAEHQDSKDEIEAFATQELTKVKHLLLNAEQELQKMKAERQVEANKSRQNVEMIKSLQEQISALQSDRLELEAKNRELTELVSSLKMSNDVLRSQLTESKDALAQMTNSQGEWLEKQIESEKSISDLEQQIRSMKAEQSHYEVDKTALAKQLEDRTSELVALKSSLHDFEHQMAAQQTVIDEHAAVVAKLELQCQLSDDKCRSCEEQILSMSEERELCRRELEASHSESEVQLKEKQETIKSLEHTVQQLTDDSAMLLQRVEELEKLQETAAADMEASVTARHQQDMKTLEDQLQEKNRIIKKQEQRLGDLKKLLQRELKVLPPAGDESSSSSSLHISSSASSNLCSDSFSSFVVPAVHTSAINHHQAATANSSSTFMEPTSPATISVSDTMSYRNGQFDGGHMSTGVLGSNFVADDYSKRVKVTGRRTSTGLSSASAVMSASDSEYDFMRELNFTYLRHVVLKFMLSREAEAMQLIKAVSMLLHFTPEEQKLIHDTLEWKMSWFGSRPQLPAKGQTAKIIPPSY